MSKEVAKKPEERACYNEEHPETVLIGVSTDAIKIGGTSKATHHLAIDIFHIRPIAQIRSGKYECPAQKLKSLNISDTQTTN